MARYTFAQLEGLWEQAGGSHKLAGLMAAIALAESHPPGDRTHADSNAVNPNDNGGRQTSWGLWQISDGTHNRPDPNILDPLDNARAAVAKLHSQGLGAWGTYTSGAYKDFLGSAKPSTPPNLPVGKLGQVPGVKGPPAPTAAQTKAADAAGASWLNRIAGDINTGLTTLFPNPFADLGNLNPASAIAGLTLPFVKFAEAIDWFFVPSHWIRIISGLAGVGLTTAGIYELAHSGQDRPAALPAGIALTGAGGVLLFVAFHNIDPSIKTVGELLSDLQAKAQTGAGATVSPQAAVTAANAA